jgi:hypothetical protein
MALTMKPACERCDRSLPAQEHGAYICSYECTFCSQCAEVMNHKCPNCAGELVGRPTRKKAEAEPPLMH